MENKKTDSKMFFGLVIIIIGLFISIYFFGFYNPTIDISEPKCVERGSVQHQIMYSSDYPLAEAIVDSGKKLGPYFDYNFCDEQ